MRSPRRPRSFEGAGVVALGLAVAVLGVAGCGSDGGGSEGAGASSPPPEAEVGPWEVFDPEGAFDYQLGGPSPVPDGATIVARDSTAEPPEGTYGVCYVNGFQTQPDESASWLVDHPDLVLMVDGEPAEDEGWPGEYALDTRTEATRAGILDVVGDVIDGCADSGFDAVELDNLDSWTRFDGLTEEGNLAMARLFVERAHDAGLAVGQKNAPDVAAAGSELGFDFVVSEECARFDECDAYADAYGDHHLDIEYVGALPDGQTFADVCARPSTPKLTILRDLLLVPADEDGYVYDRC